MSLDFSRTGKAGQTQMTVRDAQPPLKAACLKAKGTTVITENIFTNRYRQAEEFRRLGAADMLPVDR